MKSAVGHKQQVSTQVEYTAGAAPLMSHSRANTGAHHPWAHASSTAPDRLPGAQVGLPAEPCLQLLSGLGIRV